MRQLRYHKASITRLNEAEEKALYLYAAERWPDSITQPIIVTEGYDFQYDWNHEKGDQPALLVGRARLYEWLGQRQLQSVEESSNQLRALYFPGATPSDSLLYQCTLYFDELYYISPGSSVFSDRDIGWEILEGNRNEDEYTCELRSFLLGISGFDTRNLSLKQCGILRPLRPMMQEHPQFIDLLTADLEDPRFRLLVESQGLQRVFVAKKKMEPLLPLVGSGKTVDEIKDELVYRARYASRDCDGKPNLFQPEIFGVKQVDSVLAAAILLNHALLVSEGHHLIPVTDSAHEQQLMLLKLDRITALKAFPDFQRELELKSSSLAMRVLQVYLPKFKFRNVEEALEARERLRDSLYRFRTAIAQFAAQISATPFSQDLARDIEAVVAAKIRPAVDELEKQLQKTRDSFLSKLMRNARTGSIPIVASMFTGMPTEVVLGLSAGILTIEAAIETWRESKLHRRNGLTLLIG